MTRKEFLEATAEDIMRSAAQHEGYEDGIYIDIEVEGETVRIEAKFDNEDIREYLGLTEDDDVLEAYQMKDDEVDLHFLAETLKDLDREELLA